MEFFLRGAAIGFAIAAPVGPIGLLCIRRSLAGGILAGISAGLGAACADALYAALAALALGAVTRVLAVLSAPLHVAGALALVALGVRTLLSSSRSSPVQGAHARGFVATFLLTLANPATIFSFAAVVAAAGFRAAVPHGLAAFALVTGVFTGSAAWWMILSSIVGTLRRTITPRVMRVLDVASGAAIAGFGAALLLTP